MKESGPRMTRMDLVSRNMVNSWPLAAAARMA